MSSKNIEVGESRNNKQSSMTPFESQTSEKLDDIVSERVSEVIQDDLTALRNQQIQSPLQFYLKISDFYCCSFNQSTSLFLGAKFCLILPLICIETYISFWYSIFPENVRLTFLVLILLQLTFYSCLFCVDGGTLLEDEEEIYAEERYFCSRCRLYKYYSTRHCSICQKCIRGYDHHCKYFGKCIGRRNVVLFYGFFVFFCACFILSIISALNTIFEQK